MCFNNKYKFRQLHEGCYLLDNNKNQNKQKTKNKHSLKDCIEQFFNFSYENIINNKVILFDAALLVQKKKKKKKKTRSGRVMLNEVLNNYGFTRHLT